MKIFISHIHEEGQLALVLKNWIESTFLGNITVFVSSSKDDIPAGSKWLDNIDKALNECSTLIVLCSHESLKRSWINFESGCAWIKKVPIIPICHSGMTKNILPMPLALFQALDIHHESFCHDLFHSFFQKLGIVIPPRIALSEMQSEIASALLAITSTTNQNKEELKSELIEKKKSFNIISSRTIIVSNDEGDCQSISEAIKKYKTNDAIYIKSGIYEDNLLLFRGEKSYRVFGDGAETTIVYCNGSIDCVSCELTGISFISRNRTSPCLNIMGGKNNISECKFLRGRDGLMIQRHTDLEYGASENLISNNLFIDNYMGIWIGINGRAILNENIFENNLIGIVNAEKLTQTHDDIARNNRFQSNLRADYAGDWNYQDGTMDKFYKWISSSKSFVRIALPDEYRKIKYKI